MIKGWAAYAAVLMNISTGRDSNDNCLTMDNIAVEAAASTTMHAADSGPGTSSLHWISYEISAVRTSERVDVPLGRSQPMLYRPEPLGCTSVKECSTLLPCV